jgi:hypothetical protein
VERVEFYQNVQALLHAGALTLRDAELLLREPPWVSLGSDISAVAEGVARAAQAVASSATVQSPLLAAAAELARREEDERVRAERIAAVEVDVAYRVGVDLASGPDPDWSEEMLHDLTGITCGHANEVPRRCVCPASCYCKVRGTCVTRCVCGHWPSAHHGGVSGRLCDEYGCRCIEFRSEEDRVGTVAPQAPPRDNCQVCHGERGGVRGNENVVGGVVMCDYCHAELRREARLRRDAEEMCRCGHHEANHKRAGARACRYVRGDGADCECDGFRSQAEAEPTAPPPAMDDGRPRAIRVREE